MLLASPQMQPLHSLQARGGYSLAERRLEKLVREVKGVIA